MKYPTILNKKQKIVNETKPLSQIRTKLVRIRNTAGNGTFVRVAGNPASWISGKSESGASVTFLRKIGTGTTHTTRNDFLLAFMFKKVNFSQKLYYST